MPDLKSVLFATVIHVGSTLRYQKILYLYQEKRPYILILFLIPENTVFILFLIQFKQCLNWYFQYKDWYFQALKTIQIFLWYFILILYWKSAAAFPVLVLPCRSDLLRHFQRIYKTGLSAVMKRITAWRYRKMSFLSGSSSFAKRYSFSVPRVSKCSVDWTFSENPFPSWSLLWLLTRRYNKALWIFLWVSKRFELCHILFSWNTAAFLSCPWKEKGLKSDWQQAFVNVCDYVLIIREVLS